MNNCRRDFIRLLLFISAATILDFESFERQYLEFASTYSIEEQLKAIKSWICHDHRVYESGDLMICSWIRTYDNTKYITENVNPSPKTFIYRIFFLSPKVMS